MSNGSFGDVYDKLQDYDDAELRVSDNAPSQLASQGQAFRRNQQQTLRNPRQQPEAPQRGRTSDRGRKSASGKRNEDFLKNTLSNKKGRGSSIPGRGKQHRLGLDMISDWEVESERMSRGSPGSNREQDPELVENFVPVHPSHRGTLYKRKPKKKKKKKKLKVFAEVIPKGAVGFYAQEKEREEQEPEDYGEEWQGGPGADGWRNMRNRSPGSDSGDLSARGSALASPYKKYQGFAQFRKQKEEEKEALERAEAQRLGKKYQAKSALLLDDPNKILEEEEEPRGSKKNKEGKDSYSEKAGKVKSNKKGKSGAATSATAAQSGTGTEMDGDATSRGGDVTSQQDLEEKPAHERRKLERRRLRKEKEEEQEQKKGKSRKNTFDFDALDKLAEFERQEKIANGELPPDEDILIHPDEDVLFDQEDGHVAAALSYKKVKDLQWFSHCFDRQKSTRFAKVPIDWYNTDLSYIPCLKRCVKKSKWVTPTAKEIGLGPTLFLMTMKAFFWMFALFSILNIPLILLYAGQGFTDQDSGASSGGLNAFFAKFSLGNLGTSGFDCSNVNLALNEKTFRFSCKYGRLQEFFEFGVQKIDNQSCQSAVGHFVGENDAWDDLQLDCNQQNGMTSRGKEQLYKSFRDNCLGQTYCDMPIKYSWFNQDCRNRLFYYAEGSKYDVFAKDIMGWKSWQYDYRRREPVIIGVAFCVADQVMAPFTPNPLPFAKSQFTYFLLGVDFFTVFFMICFINLLETRYEEYSEVFDKRNVEIRDFTLDFTNLPKDFEYGGKELMFQANLWNFMEKHVKAAIMQTAGDDQDLIEQYEEERQWEVMDINFVTSDWTELDMLNKMDELDRDKKRKIHALQKQNEGKEKTEENADAMNEANDEANEAIIEVIQQFKEIKGAYIDIQEEKLYEKWTMTPEKNRSESTQTFRRAYVTFKSMLGKDRAEQLFKFAKDDKRVGAEEKMFYGRWMDVESPIAFQSFIGNHLRLSPCNRRTRSIIIWILAFAIIAAALVAMVVFTNYNASLVAAVSQGENCPPEVAADVAFEDYLKPLAQRQGLLHCFCLATYNQNGGNVEPAMANFTKVESHLAENPCTDWKFSYDWSFYLTIISGALIAVTNAVCVAVFEQVPVLFEGCATYQDESKAQFVRVVAIQFCTIGLVLLFADFSLGEVSDAGIPILQGRFRDFDTDWYLGVGAKISFAMISNSIAPFFAECFQPVVVAILRFASRNFKIHLLKKTNVEAEKKKQKEKEEAEAKKAEESGGGLMARMRAKRAAQQAEKENKSKELAEEGQGEDEKEDDEGGEQVVSEAPETYRSRSPLKQKRRRHSFQADGGDDEAGAEGSGLEAEASGSIEPGDEEDGEEKEEEELEYGLDEPECEGAFGIMAALGHLFQDDLNAFYLNPPIKTFYWYAWFFTNLCIYLMYGGALPLMYPLGVIFFMLMFYVNKFLFTRFHRKSFGFDETVPFYSVKLMKWALFFHLLMNCFMFTNKRLMVPPDYTTEEHYRPAMEAPPIFFQRRYDTLSSQAVIYVFLLVIVLYIFYRTCIQPLVNCCKRCGERKRAFKLEDKALATTGKDREALEMLVAEDFSDDIVKELNIRYLRTFYIRAHKEYELFRTMVNAISYDQEKLSDEDAMLFKKRLKQRIRHIEDTIDVHLNLIGGLETFMDRTYMYKLAVLEENEEKIPMKDKKSQRMVDMVQSYNGMDSMDFAKAQLIQNRLDREMLELEYLQKPEQPVYC